MSANTTRAAATKDMLKPGLVFDADTITLSGKFTDELSAYRARKKWKEVFGSHFLLETERDYDMAVNSSSGCFVLTCVFHSACGRYAFWRMINRQAPDAESKLYSPNMINEKAARFLLGAVWNTPQSSPWVLTSTNRQTQQSTIISTVFSRIQKTFWQ